MSAIPDPPGDEHPPGALPAGARAGAIRRLTPADAAVYRELMLEAYALHPDAFTSTVKERSALPLAWWERRLAPDAPAGELVLGAWDPSGALAGAAGLACGQPLRTRHKATLFGMVVRAPHQRQGWGRALVAAVLALARQQPGLALVQLTVTDGNQAARALYEACGFRAWGVEPQAVRLDDGRLCAKVHLWCALDRPGPASACAGLEGGPGA